MSDKTLLFLTITNRGDGRRLLELLNRHKIVCHLQFMGQGTASSEMMHVLGLDNSDKDVLLSVGSETAVSLFLKSVADRSERLHGFRGIMMVLSMEAVNNLVAVIARRQTEESTQEVVPMEKSEYEYSLVLAAVNQGFSDQVMASAKKAGATGGTVIRSHLANTELAARTYGLDLQEEKEIVAIMTSHRTRDAIMEAINTECGMRSDAQAILLSLPVEKALKL